MLKQCDRYCYNTANNYVLKFNNRTVRKRCGIYSKLTTKTPEWRQWRGSDVFIVSFEHILHLLLVFLWLTLNSKCLRGGFYQKYLSVIWNICHLLMFIHWSFLTGCDYFKSLSAESRCFLAQPKGQITQLGIYLLKVNNRNTRTMC